MRKDFGVKSWFYPLPVLIIGTYNDDGSADAMNAAWGGLYDSDLVELCLSAGHRTTKNIQKKRAFTISFADAAHVTAADYVGIVSGNNAANKLEKTGWHTTKSEFVDAPVIDELPMTLECSLVSYDPATCRLVGKIVNVSADEKVLDGDGKIDPDKLHPITFDPIHSAYRKLGEKVGNAFRDGNQLK